MLIERHLEAVGRAAIVDALDVDAPAILRPAQPQHGDYQVNGVLGLAKKLRKNPRELAEKVAARLREDAAIGAAEVAGPGFINLRLDTGWVTERLRAMLQDRARDGVPAVEDPETIVIDFSSPNIAKPMHVGHLRSTIIGDALVRLHRFVGHEVVGDNHLGDWGTQFGLLIVGMREWGDDDKLAEDPITELGRVYKLASARAAQEDDFAESARAELAKLQAGDPENTRQWERFVEVSRASLEEIYARLDVTFDEWLGESAYHDRLAGVVQQLLDAEVAREDAGAICVFFNELEGVEGKLAKQEVPFIIRKGDGAYLYSTSDIAAVQYRRERWDADRAIYVVDRRQAGHFHQLFEVMRQLGESMTLEHVGFGTVMGADGKPLKARAGTVLTLASLLDEAEERAERKMIEELGLDPEMARELRGPIGIGAVKYADLMQNRTSDYKFDWDKLIAFNGNAGPYIQYMHARCCSILRKAELAPNALDDAAVTLDEDAERALALRLLKLGDVVYAAAESNNPHYVAEHLYGLADELSRFYTECKVLGDDDALRRSRLALTDLTRRQLARALGLLGIAAPARM